jgi:hypothetical protein
MMLKSPEYGTWDKIVHVHDAITQMVVIEANKKAYDQHLADFSASLTALPANKPPTAAVANDIVKAPSASTSTSTKLTELSIGLDEPCVVHPKGSTRINSVTNRQRYAPRMYRSINSLKLFKVLSLKMKPIKQSGKLTRKLLARTPPSVNPTSAEMTS